MRKWLLLALLAFCLAPSSIGSAATDELRPFVRGSWQDIRKAHAGRPTVVHFWGVTCGPCRTEMPEWGKLLLERADLSLVVINADLVPNEPSAVSAIHLIRAEYLKSLHPFGDATSIGHAFIKVVLFGVRRSFCETCGRITGHPRRIGFGG